MIRIAFIVAFFFGFTGTTTAQYRRDVHKEMDRLDADVALMLRRDLEFMPVWSEGSDSIYVNVQGYWYTLEIARTSLVKTEIDDHRGGWNQNEILETIPSAFDESIYLPDMEANIRFAEQDNIKATITQEELKSILVVEIDGGEYYRQESNREAFLFPRISPDGKFLVFIGDRSGLLMIRLKPEKSKLTKVEKKLNKAIDVMNDNNCEKSMRLFEGVLAEDSANVVALHNVALCQFNLNLLDELEKTIEIGLRHDPDYFETNELLASLHYLRGEYEEAAEVCEVIMAEHPYYYENYYLLLATYEALEDLQNICRTLKNFIDAGLVDKELEFYYLSSCN
ncbi:MAG: hypothetical protein Crog4KO_31720 [Crocinitomicaceae bacterium]